MRFSGTGKAGIANRDTVPVRVCSTTRAMISTTTCCQWGRLIGFVWRSAFCLDLLSDERRGFVPRCWENDLAGDTGSSGEESEKAGARRWAMEEGKRKNPTFVGWGFCLKHEEPDDYLLSHGSSALSSAWSRFTVLFGMGRGGTNSLWSSGMTCCCVVSWGTTQPIREEVVEQRWGATRS